MGQSLINQEKEIKKKKFFQEMEWMAKVLLQEEKKCRRKENFSILRKSLRIREEILKSISKVKINYEENEIKFQPISKFF